MTRRRVAIDLVSIGFVGLVAPAAGAAATNAVGGGDPAAAAASILMAAAGLRPIRRACASVADRIRPPSPDAFDRLQRLAAGLTGLPATTDALADVARFAAETLGTQWARVSVEAGGRADAQATWPIDAPVPSSARSAPVVQGGQHVGTLSVDMPEEGNPPSPGSVPLADAAHLLAPFLRDVLLVHELEARVAHLEEQAVALLDARRRTVAVADRERRRLERNLHDGAQQQLTALIFRLSVALDVVRTAPEHAPAVMAELSVMADDVVTSIVELGNGAGPRLLHEHGLAQALLVHVAHLPVPVDVHVEHVDRHAGDVEAAVWFSCLEAIQNAVRHAGATRVRVTLEETAGELRFAVSDDGRGFDPAVTAPGAGLRNVTDRLVALGGSSDVVSMPGEGTTVVGRVPLGAPVLELA